MGNVFKIRITATALGKWTYKSGANVEDTEPVGISDEFEAIPWTNKDKLANELRKGFIHATEDQHAFMHADGSPFILLGDTWWATPTFRYK